MTEIKIGQEWKDLDPRNTVDRILTIAGFDEATGKVLIKPRGDRSNRAPSKAKPERFNGKRGGYVLVKDAS
jgi:hypothetical protein